MRSIGFIAIARLRTVIWPGFGELYGAGATWSGLALADVWYAAMLAGFSMDVSDMVDWL
jgi:hypothetical protein